MKAFILILFIFSVSFAGEGSFRITKKTTDYTLSSAKSGKRIRKQTFRGKTKIRDRSERDTDGDGVIDHVFDSFWIDGECLYSTMETKTERSSSFSSHGDVVVLLIKSKTADRIEKISFFSSKGRILEMFVRNVKGEFEPLSKEEFAKAVQQTKELPPIAKEVLETIQNKTLKKYPNKNAHEAAGASK